MTWWRGGSDSPGATAPLKPSPSLARTLDEYLAHAEVQPRKLGWHASALFWACPRALALEALAGLPAKLAPSAKSQLRMDTGSALHEWIQNRYFGPMGVLHGEWRCLSCRTVLLGAYPRGVSCCASQAWHFEEPSVEHKEPGWSLPIVGRCDGEIILPGEDGLGILEIKTMNSASLQALTEIPRDYHMQAQIYAGLRGRKWGRFYFQDPSAAFSNEETGLPVREFRFDFQPEVLRQAFARVEACEKALREAQAAHMELPMGKDYFSWPEPICSSKSDTGARRCRFADACFSGPTMERIKLRLMKGEDPKELLG